MSQARDCACPGRGEAAAFNPGLHAQGACRAADMNAYRVFAGNVLWQLPGVRETRTYAVMEEVKHSSHLHLR